MQRRGRHGGAGRRSDANRRDKRIAAEMRGRRAELWAALYLMAKGWRIVDRRVKTKAGEVDLIAVRGGVAAAVEVKARPTWEDGVWAVPPAQVSRISAAFALWLAARPAMREMTPRLDLVVISPWRLPRHLPGAWPYEGR